MAILTKEDEKIVLINPLADSLSDTQNEFLRDPAKGLHYLERPVNSELASIYQKLQLNSIALALFTRLTELVANKARDIHIWQAVLDLIANTSRVTTPSSSIAPSYIGTPLSQSTACYQGSSLTRKELQHAIAKELSGRTYKDVPEFICKYFESKAWSGRVAEILKEIPQADPLYGLPLKPTEDEFWTWLLSFQQRYLGDAANVFYRAKTQGIIIGARVGRQFDVLLKCRAIASGESHHIKDCLHVGELTKSDTSVWKNKFVQLATYVRDVFSAQPTRLFVHALLVFGVKMELWTFDRSGAYSAQRFNIREKPTHFLQVMIGYTFMTAEELGLDTFIQHDEVKTSVRLEDPTTGENRKFQLDSNPFFSRNAITCRGTTCYLTADGNHVVKSSWRANQQHSEVDHLRNANGVIGVPTLVGQSQITAIRKLRSGLQITNLRNLGHTPNEKTDDTTQSSSVGLFVQQFKGHSSSGTKHSPQPESDCPWRDRVFTCLAITPAGRPLNKFENVREVIVAFQDAIKAHKQLFMDRRILHRDILFGNIILTIPDENNRCTGMLIDFDLAVEVDANGTNKKGMEKAMTGTLEYMAIEILEGSVRQGTAGLAHTYRHDLESFFYLFLVLCIRHGWVEGTKPKVHAIENWYIGEYEDMTLSKRGSISNGRGFAFYILDKFSPTFDCVKPLAKRLRDILFVKDSSEIEIPSDPKTLYDPMIAAFGDAIKSLDCVMEVTEQPASIDYHNSEPSLDHKRKAATLEDDTRKKQQRTPDSPSTNSFASSGSISSLPRTQILELQDGGCFVRVRSG